MHRSISACATLALAILIAGCAAPSSPVTPGPTGSPTPGGATVPAPGLQRPAAGPAVAFGWVVREDLEGGFWALEDRPPTSSVSRPKVVVVLLPGAVTEAGIARLAGSYARATGTVTGGVSTRMAGPEMKVDSISAAQDTAPK